MIDVRQLQHWQEIFKKQKQEECIMRESRLITLLQLQKPEGLQALISTYQAYVGTIIRNITRSSLSCLLYTSDAADD